jgi:hypothetical protein
MIMNNHLNRWCRALLLSLNDASTNYRDFIVYLSDVLLDFTPLIELDTCCRNDYETFFVKNRLDPNIQPRGQR